jgi:hypothetical protein
MGFLKRGKGERGKGLMGNAQCPMTRLYLNVRDLRTKLALPHALCPMPFIKIIIKTYGL